jgi:hypothetical protein
VSGSLSLLWRSTLARVRGSAAPGGRHPRELPSNLPLGCHPDSYRPLPEPQFCDGAHRRTEDRTRTETRPYQYGYRCFRAPRHNGRRVERGRGEHGRPAAAGERTQDAPVASRFTPHTMLRPGRLVVACGARSVREDPQGFAAVRGSGAVSRRSRTSAAHGGLAGAAGKPVAGVLSMAVNEMQKSLSGRRSGKQRADRSCVWGTGR